MTKIKNEKLAELVAANPQDRAEIEKVEMAIDVVRQRRAAGIAPKQYELAAPFGHRMTLRHVRSA